MWRCRNCQRKYDWAWVHPACPVCFGPLDRQEPIRFRPETEDPQAPGLWRYRAALGLPDSVPPVSLEEGRTPLQPVRVGEDQVLVKREDLNPTGSVKDRAAAVLFTWARAQGVQRAATLATPNTWRAWQRYARAAGVRLRAYTAREALGEHPGPAAAQEIPGDWHQALTVLHQQEEWVLVPYHPLALDAYATIAYELVAQLGRAPGTVVVPVGQASLLLGIGRGFVALQQAGVIEQMPRLIGVEPLARAGLWAQAHGGRETHLWVRELAPVPTPEAGRRFPWWGDLALYLVAWSQGRFLPVADEEWVQARDAMRRAGLYLQPEAALVWAAWVLHGRDWPRPVVLVFTGGQHVQPRVTGQPWWRRILSKRRERS